MMREDTLLQQAISAARAGHELTARDIFLEIIEINPRNEIAWMWLTGLLDDLDDCIYACEMVLDINPHHASARQYLDQLQVKKQKQLAEEKLHAQNQLQRARELVRSNHRGDALALVRDVTQRTTPTVEAWRLLADLSTDMEDRLLALEKLLTLTPGDAKVRHEVDRIRHFKNNPLDLAAMYEEQGNIDKAIETYGLASLRPDLKNKGNSIHRKIVQLENLRFENIAHVSPGASVARLTAGPPLLYLMLLLVHVGINPLAQPEPFLWIGFIWVVLGGIMIAFASVRSRHRLWSTLFKDAGSGGTPVARFLLAAAGWVLLSLPFLLMFFTAFNRLFHFDFFR